MDKNHICKICNKRFANGKAMGGHIRSHLDRLPLPPKPNTPPPQQKQHPPLAHNPYCRKPSPSPSSSSSSSLNYTSSGYRLMSYYKSISHHVYNLANTSISTATALHDGESEAESPKNLTRRRSKRRRKSVDKVIEQTFLKASDSPERVSSSVTDAFNEVDAATCLLMLSSSNKNTRKGKQVAIDDEEQEEVDVNKFIEEEEYNKVRLEKEAEEKDEEDESYYLTNSYKPAPRSLGKYKCETCNKSFKSYQALGGHRASHKKTKPIKNIVNIEEDHDNKFEDDNVAGVVTGQRIFRCSFCGKEFESGQALGGHKKVHFPYLGNNPIPNPKSTAGPCGIKNFIDLNFPPPEEAS